jgi:hypothetical protein
MESPQRIVFRGEIIEGFAAEEVKLSAQSRLSASLSQIEQLFSGRPAILKKDLDAVSGARYLALLAHIGMRASLEAQSAEASPEPEAQSPEPASPIPASPASAAFDAERTQLASAADLARYLSDAPAPAPEPVTEAEASFAPVAEPEPATAREPASLPERVASEVRRAGLARPPAQSPAAQPPLTPRPTPRVTPAPLSDPQTVFFEDEASGQPKTPALPSSKASHWPERLLLALIAAGIGYTLYWAVTRY